MDTPVQCITIHFIATELDVMHCNIMLRSLTPLDTYGSINPAVMLQYLFKTLDHTCSWLGELFKKDQEKLRHIYSWLDKLFLKF